MPRIYTKKETLNRIINNIPIPVYDMFYIEFFKKYKTMSEENHIFQNIVPKMIGQYSPYYNFIFVYKHLPISQKVFVLLHEYKHYLCRKNNCSCISDHFYIDHFYVEYCAQKYVLQECVKNNYLSPLYCFIKDIEKNYLGNEIPHKVSKKIMKLKNFKKALKILKEHKYLP